MRTSRNPVVSFSWYLVNPGRFVFFFLALLTLVTSCKKDNPEINPIDALVANAGPDQPVQVGQTVTLDGGASKDGQRKPLTYQWAITQKPAKSSVALTVPNTVRLTFVPDEVGEYELTLTVSNGEKANTDKVLVTASAAQPLTLNKDITVKTVLEDRIVNPNLPDYIVPKSIAVSHELTINPGVVIAFERDVTFTITDRGFLIAKGTADQKIRFVGVNQSKGYWAGIMLNSESNVNLMEHVEVLHAGSRIMLDNKKAGMVMFKGSQMAIKNSLFGQHDGYGLFASDEAVLREFSANTFSGNTDAGILLSTENVAKLDAASVFTSGNGRNVVEINGSYIGETGQKDEIVWGGFADKTPYRLLNDIAVRTGWKLSPGVTIESSRDVVIIINESAYLNAVGTADQKIRFTGIGGTTAYWTGILCHSPSAKNQLENAEISNGGSNSIIAGKKANLALYGNQASITVKRTRIAGSGGYGILVGFGGKLNEEATSTNAFANNAQDDVLIEE
ncbi:PKD domain-containing protein [Tellurirhabdus bombi]|uniref:PKD domain-containing protein n=1 Tax=Tellurirhabdus bombi TaxID=2907205 RepID=UPI001F337F11|nr:PKD domain-containing protein [Tellurirhabdus bombi]